jgi:N-dimethylarginine dimethylaminohydrolase
MPESQEIIRALDINKIEVSLQEATGGFACNLVSTGDVVIMSSDAPRLKAAIEAEGLRVVTPIIRELAKGGGYIRCTSLTLDN